MFSTAPFTVRPEEELLDKLRNLLGRENVNLSLSSDLQETL